MRKKLNINPKQSRKRRISKSVKMHKNNVKQMYHNQPTKKLLNCPEGYSQCHRGKLLTLQCCPDNQ